MAAFQSVRGALNITLLCHSKFFCACMVFASNPKHTTLGWSAVKKSKSWAPALTGSMPSCRANASWCLFRKLQIPFHQLWNHRAGRAAGLRQRKQGKTCKLPNSSQSLLAQTVGSFTATAHCLVQNTVRFADGTTSCKRHFLLSPLSRQQGATDALCCALTFSHWDTGSSLPDASFLQFQVLFLRCSTATTKRREGTAASPSLGTGTLVCQPIPICKASYPADSAWEKG